jgi:hypothetical protein
VNRARDGCSRRPRRWVLEPAPPLGACAGPCSGALAPSPAPSWASGDGQICCGASALLAGVRWSLRGRRGSSSKAAADGVKLFDGASLRVSHGRRYGFVGPNGKGKSNLLKLLAWRRLPVPRNIDVLLVEQEVAGDGRPAIVAVIQADDEQSAVFN